jgi:curved DNA-binding protein CbpA
MNKDYYDILGVPLNTSKDEIKRAYHILATQFHPDKPHGSEKRFKEINEAYRILSHDESRAEYDRTYRASTEKQNYTNKPPSSPPPSKKPPRPNSAPTKPISKKTRDGSLNQKEIITNKNAGLWLVIFTATLIALVHFLNN